MEKRLQVVVRAASLESFREKVAALKVKRAEILDEKGLLVDEYFGRCEGLGFETADGKYVTTIWCNESDADKLRGVLLPEITCDYIEGEVEVVEREVIDDELEEVTMEEVEQPVPWPVYDVSVTDEEGTTMTQKRAAGRIQA